MYSHKSRVIKKTKPPFLISLEKWQTRYINYLESQGIKAKKECFYIEHDEIAVLATESEYRQMLEDENVSQHLAYLGQKFGMSLSLCKTKYALHIHFHYGSGFLCYKKFYGKYKKHVHGRLKKELTGLVTLNVGGELKETENTKQRKIQRKKWEKEIEKILEENE